MQFHLVVTVDTGAEGETWGASIFKAFLLSVFFKKLLLSLVLTSVNPDVGTLLLRV